MLSLASNPYLESQTGKIQSFADTMAFMSDEHNKNSALRNS
jgi:hypothetical protein